LTDEKHERSESNPEETSATSFEPSQPNPDENEDVTEIMEMLEVINNSSLISGDEHDHDFYQETWFGYVVTFIILTTIVISVLALVQLSLSDFISQQFSFSIVLYFFIFSRSIFLLGSALFTIPFTCIMYTLYAALLAKLPGNPSHKYYETVLRVFTFIYFLSSTSFTTFFGIWVGIPFLLLVPYVPLILYVFICLVDRFIPQRKSLKTRMREV
jgi:hypothetical protein